VLVKICGITTEADALLAVALGADAIGFIFAPSSRQVSVQATRRIVERVPPEILTVGVFRDEAPARVVEIVNSIGLKAAQLHGNETTEQSRWVAERIALTIKAFPAGHSGIGRIDEYGAELVLVDAESPGSGEVFDWRLAEGVVDPARLIVSGGLRPENVGDAIAHLRPFGVDVDSGVEAAPGRKDPVKVRAFVTAARTAAGEEMAARDGDGEGDEGPGGIDRPFDWREEGG
jgi:phosphoribosylanthranilate isomerase